MSSYVISKSEYMKAAGFCAALAEHKHIYYEPLRIWDPEAGKVATAAEFKKYFSHLFKLNAAAYAYRYNETDIFDDPDNYDDAFEAARAATKSAINASYRGDNKINVLIFGFYHFSHSILYQMDEKRAEKLAAEFLRYVCAELLQIMGKFANIHIDPANFWGCFPTDEID